MKKYFVFILLGALAFSTAFKQEVLDPKAKAVLDKIKTKYTAYKNIKVDFTFTLNDKELNEPESFAGKLYLKGKKFRLETDQMNIVSNNKYLWMHLKDADRLQIQDYDPDIMTEEFGFTPEQIFNVNKDDFYYKLNDKTKINDVEVNEIELTPKDKEKSYYKIKMYATTAENKVLKVTFYESMATYTIAINTQTPNVEMSDDTFTIDESKFDDENIEDFRTN